MRKLNSEMLSHRPMITQPEEAELIPNAEFPLSLNYTIYDFGLTHITMTSCSLWICGPTFLGICAVSSCAVIMQSHYDSKRWWASCSLCIRLISNFVTQNMQKLSGPYNFPHRKLSRCSVTFWVFRGWQRTRLKINLSLALPEEACSLKMSLPSPFQNTDITSWSEALPSQTSSCIRRSLPPTFFLGEGRGVSLVSKKKRLP